MGMRLQGHYRRILIPRPGPVSFTLTVTVENISANRTQWWRVGGEYSENDLCINLDQLM